MKKNISLGIKVGISAFIALLLGIVIVKEFNVLQSHLSFSNLFQGLLEQRQRVKAKAMITTINHYRPDLSKWKLYIQSEQIPDERFVRESLYYYTLITKYLPDSAQAYHLLAVCHFLQGDIGQALEAQQRSLQLEPHYFWGWFNLGVLAYEQKDYRQAAEAFKKALALPTPYTGKVMSTSMIFVEIIRGSQTAPVLTSNRVSAGYRQAAEMFQECLEQLKAPSSPRPAQKIMLRIF